MIHWVLFSLTQGEASEEEESEDEEEVTNAYILYRYLLVNIRRIKPVLIVQSFTMLLAVAILGWRLFLLSKQNVPMSSYVLYVFDLYLMWFYAAIIGL